MKLPPAPPPVPVGSYFAHGFELRDENGLLIGWKRGNYAVHLLGAVHIDNLKAIVAWLESAE